MLGVLACFVGLIVGVFVVEQTAVEKRHVEFGQRLWQVFGAEALEQGL
jgi:hypothetical protein